MTPGPYPVELTDELVGMAIDPVMWVIFIIFGLIWLFTMRGA
jgi:hypothetical protein